MELILIRHTTVKIEKGTCYGQSDLAVTDSFEKEKNIILKNLDIADIKIISSPLKRCTQLANSFLKDFKTDHRIMELNFGNWEMQKWDDINDPELDIWMNNYIHHRCPNGESLLDMKFRIEDFYNEIRSQKHKKLIIITHGGVIRLFYHLIKGVALDRIFDIKVNFGEIHTFKI